MAKGSKREGGGIGELLAYAGDRKFLTYLGMALSALYAAAELWPVRVHLACRARPYRCGT